MAWGAAESGEELLSGGLPDAGGVDCMGTVRASEHLALAVVGCWEAGWAVVIDNLFGLDVGG